MVDHPRATTLSPVIVAIDQGTSSTKAIAVNAAGQIVARASVAIGQSHPHAGWVEQDADEIVQSVHTALEQLDLAQRDVRAIGLSSQRESAVAWERANGKPLGPVLGWQDRRTNDRARELVSDGNAERVREITGLPIDPMFSALKFEWLLDQCDPDRMRSAAGEIAVGTVDSWLVATLTGEHRIEVGNASRTQLLDLDAVAWSDELCALFRVPLAVLPRIAASNEPTHPITSGAASGTTIHAILGDSHAALYGHGVRGAGEVKVTFGTGSSIMGLTAAEAPAGLVRTIAWHDGEPRYAFEGNILSAGSTMVWLAELLGSTPEKLFALARETADGGVDLVPAFAGLGAPWWDEQARGTVTGLTLGSTAGELARAAADSIALQIDDVLAAVELGTGTLIERIIADGGPSGNDWLMQLQADYGQRLVARSDVAEVSALGAAHLAGIGAEMWTVEDVNRLDRPRTDFAPQLSADTARYRRARWLAAVDAARQPSVQHPTAVLPQP